MSQLTTKEKLKLVLELTEKHSITPYQIGKNTTLDSSAVHRILTGEVKKPRDRTLTEILEFIEKTIVGTQLGVEEKPEVYQRPAISNKKGVPYLNVDFSSGYEHFYNTQKINPDFYIDYEPYNNADMWVNNVGNSMSPKIESGDLIAIKHKTDIRQIIYGEIYAIVMPEMRTVKYIRKSEKENHVKFVPENSIGFDEQDMPIELITNFFLVLGAIKKFF